jgi:hypothetical protein
MTRLLQVIKENKISASYAAPIYNYPRKLIILAKIEQ